MPPPGHWAHPFSSVTPTWRIRSSHALLPPRFSIDPPEPLKSSRNFLHRVGSTGKVELHMLTSSKVSICFNWSGQILIFHQPRFPWNKGISLTKPPFGMRSCEVAIIWPELMKCTLKHQWEDFKDVCFTCFTSPRLRGSLGDFLFINTDWLTPSRYWHLFYPIFSTLVVFQLFRYLVFAGRPMPQGKWCNFIVVDVGGKDMATSMAMLLNKNTPLRTSWWLNQPLWKILVKMGIFPK